ncbi:MAG TPA: sn-glycerol-3-phosphate ABC transporter substrate-binding protein UgpB [Casimicrobiaceae bacterium]|nr:sn-glycerol-3-phosphate ABC transporter substrate-binding protein UgpB [Casimicrobiaceae bacterium]
MHTRKLGAARVVLVAALFGLATQAQAVTEIQWWHSMTGALNDRVDEIANKFNASQKDYKVTPIYKGQYDESMTAAIAAYRAGNPPQIVQVFEVGTATMMAAKGAVKPVYQLMSEQKEPFNPKGFLGAVYSYYSDTSGNLISMPFNSSTQVLYINDDAFKKAGLDPTKPPKTWPEVEKAAEKLKASGAPCAFTTGWQSWVQLESFSAWHNVPFSTLQDGFGGLGTRLELNGPVQVKHIQNLGDWAKKGLFTYKGRKDEPLASFTSGECAMITTSSGSYANIKANAKFAWRVATLPYYPDVKGAPQNTIIGGATLWVLNQKNPEMYKGIAKFFTFLSSPEIQEKWHSDTGYVPITLAAYDLAKSKGLYQERPGFDIAINELNNKPPTANSKGLRLGNFVQIRNIIDEELEAVWSGQKTAKQALDEMVKRGNEQLERFQKANEG